MSVYKNIVFTLKRAADIISFNKKNYDFHIKKYRQMVSYCQGTG